MDSLFLRFLYGAAILLVSYAMIALGVYGKSDSGSRQLKEAAAITV